MAQGGPLFDLPAGTVVVGRGGLQRAYAGATEPIQGYPAYRIDATQDSGGWPAFLGAYSNGSFASPAPVASGDVLLEVSGHGFGPAGFGAGGGGMYVQADEAFTASARGTRIAFFAVAAGATNASQIMQMRNSDLRPQTDNSLDLGTSARRYKDARLSGVLYIGTTQVLTSRRTGWTAATGTASRGTFDTATVTTPQLAQRVKALIDDFITHGAIGA